MNMIKSKLHNPIIAKNSHIENAVIEKVDLSTELLFSDLGNTTPVVPETGRIWFNTESGTFKFANIGKGGDNNNYVDEFLSRTDKRHQSVASKVDFNDTVKIKAVGGAAILTVDSSSKNITVSGAQYSETLTGTSSSTVVGDVTENYQSNQTTNVTGNLGIKVDGVATFRDSGDNVKLSSDHVTNTLTANYATVNINGQTETHTLSNKFVVNNGTTDKFIIDNTGNKVTINYGTVETTNTDVFINTTGKLTLTNGVADKIVANNQADTLDINYGDINVTGNTTFDGNMIVTGDLTIGGHATKVTVAAENMTIADNVIVLNSNLTTEDPRLASALVEGTNVDSNAGIAVNRGSEGILDLIKWVESADTSTVETLKMATAQVSIWNYEAATPAYELHQILDAYTAGRQVKDKSGASWIGYDGEVGSNYTNAINSGATPAEALEYSFKIEPGKLDGVIDSIIQEIDTIKFGGYNTVRVGETPAAGTSFTITHNLGTVFVDVRIQREEAGKWYFDVLPTQVVDANTVKVESSESTKIRYMISAIEGFDVNQATELLVI